MFDLYLWIKALHIIAVIFWMAGLLMLPRFLAYQRGAEPGGELEEKMKVAAEKLHKIILTPAMLASVIFGAVLIGYRWSEITSSVWLPLKLILVFGLIYYHAFLSGERKKFARSERPRTEKFYRMVNEVPAIAVIFIVILAIVEPF